MCLRSTIIAASADPNRYIACCEHSTYHIAWDFCTVHLSYESVVSLAELLETMRADMERGAVKTDPADPGHVQLWFNKVGLRLTQADVTQLLYLVRTTLATPLPPPEWDLLATDETAMYRRFAPPQFSKN